MFGFLLGLALVAIAVFWFQQRRQGHSKHNAGQVHGHGGHSKHGGHGGCH